MSDVDESAKKLSEALIRKGLPKLQVDEIVKKYKENMLKIRCGKPELCTANKIRGEGKWTKKKIIERLEAMRNVRH